MRRVFYVALLVILGLAVHSYAKCPDTPGGHVKKGNKWNCGRKCFEEETDRNECKAKRDPKRRHYCTAGDKTSRKWYCMDNMGQCKGADAYKSYCDISSNADGEAPFVTLKCMGSGKQGKCLLHVKPSFDELEDTEKVSYTDAQDYYEDYRDDATLEVCRDKDCIENYCRLRCLASSDCHGFEFETASTGGFHGKCRLILNPVYQSEGDSADTSGKATKCFVRDQTCANKPIPSSCTRELSKDSGCWGAGPGYKPCKDLACSEEECKWLCQLNTKCQGFEIGPDDPDEEAGFPTCIHYDLLPKAVNTAVAGSCFSVARSHQFNDVGCSPKTADSLPEGLDLAADFELNDQDDWNEEKNDES